jgi:two-component system, OmpR family, copper resistance phosphate regulon response regulator CusR
MEDLNILVIEDEKKIADSLKQGLNENSFCVEVAYDGRSGLGLFADGNFDMIILDLNLPDISGYEVSKEIRANNSKVPIIMLTALSTVDDKVEGFESGADDYLVKPFDFKELIARIRALMKRSNIMIATSNVIKVADLVLNLDNREVNRGGKKITLTAKEFQLLEFLVKNKNKVVSRAEIALNVWDIDFDTKTNVIDVYVNFLRKKLDNSFDKKLIHTQVGTGYILKESA